MPNYKGIYKSFMVAIFAGSLFLLFSYTIKSSTPPSQKQGVQNSFNKYSSLHFTQFGLSDDVYQMALTGWRKLKEGGEVSKDILAICDFTQSSNNKRLYVIDLANGALLFNTLVAHGRNTGEEFAHSFSNDESSNKSSLGFYVTGETYTGEHGLSLKLNGKEQGFNDNAGNRAIVMHGADYVSFDFIRQFGRLGRSLGCPAIPFDMHEQIIQAIKEGSCLFIYYPDKNYLLSSNLLR